MSDEVSLGSFLVSSQGDVENQLKVWRGRYGRDMVCQRRSGFNRSLRGNSSTQGGERANE